MKSSNSRKVIVIVSALFVSLLLNSASAETDQKIYQKSATQLRSDNGDARLDVCQNYGRDDWQKPAEVVKSMNLKSGDVIVDIGAGDGYFTRRFAKVVSPGGQAIGLEVSSMRVESMKRDAEREGLDKYKAVLVETDDPGLDRGSVDVVFLCNAYHHLENRVDYFKKTSRGLKKDGRVVVVDFYNKRMDVGPPPSHTLAKEVVLEEMKDAGYTLLKDEDFLSYQYYLEFGLN